MDTLVVEKEYRELIAEKKRAEKALWLFTVKNFDELKKKKGLIDLSKLKLKKGPKDLSLYFDSYLYQK